MFLLASNALRRAGAFVAGVDVGAVFSVGLLAVVIGTGASLR
jgi:hypothetical protein